MILKQILSTIFYVLHCAALVAIVYFLFRFINGD